MANEWTVKKMRLIDADALAEKLCAYTKAMVALGSAPTLSLNTLRDEIYQDAVEHGLWEDVDAYADKYAEMCGCGIEADMRKHMKNCCASSLVLDEAEEMYGAAECDDWDAVKEELADTIIMCMSAAGYLGIDIDAAIRRKMEINKGRPWKHGKEDK